MKGEGIIEGDVSQDEHAHSIWRGSDQLRRERVCEWG